MYASKSCYLCVGWWSGGATALGNLPVLGHPTILMIVGQGPTALAIGAGRGCLDIFSLIYHFSFLSPSLWETARYRLKYCLKGPLTLKQPTNNLCVHMIFSSSVQMYRKSYCTIPGIGPSAFSRRAVVSYWQKYVHEVLVNRLGGLSLPRKSVVRLSDRPDMTLDVYRGRKTSIQQQLYPALALAAALALVVASLLAKL